MKLCGLNLGGFFWKSPAPPIPLNDPSNLRARISSMAPGSSSPVSKVPDTLNLAKAGAHAAPPSPPRPDSAKTQAVKSHLADIETLKRVHGMGGPHGRQRSDSLDRLMPTLHDGTEPPTRHHAQNMAGFNSSLSALNKVGIRPTEGELVTVGKIVPEPAPGKPGVDITYRDFEDGGSATIPLDKVVGQDFLTHHHPDGSRYASFVDYEASARAYLKGPRTESLFTSGKNVFRIEPDDFRFTRIGTGPTPAPSPTHPLRDADPWGHLPPPPPQPPREGG